MIKQHYKVLKYIHRHKKISKAELLKKFPFFESCLTYISEYVYVEDENEKNQNAIKDSLVIKAKELNLNIGQTSEYINANMPELPYDDSLVFYFTKLSFQEYLEKKRHDAWLFWFPYTITTIIAAISAIPTVVKIIEYISGLFLKGAP